DERGVFGDDRVDARGAAEALQRLVEAVLRQERRGGVGGLSQGVHERRIRARDEDVAHPSLYSATTSAAAAGVRRDCVTLWPTYAMTKYEPGPWSSGTETSMRPSDEIG